MENKSVILALIESGNVVSVKPNGRSMLPTLNGVTDKVEVRKPTRPLRRGDLALYTDSSGETVLHRVLKTDKKSRTYIMRGDGNIFPEEPLSFDKVFAVGTHIIKNGKRISVHNPIYRLKSFAVHLRRLQQASANSNRS